MCDVNIIFSKLPSAFWHCWLVIRQSIQSVKKFYVTRCWSLSGILSGMRCKWFAYDPADATATQSSLA